MSAQYQGSEKFKPAWADPVDVQNWLRRELFIGETLNFPCGESSIGDVTADIDPERNPDVVADLTNPLEEFEPQSFDTVYCDPPFNLYGYSDGFFPAEVWKLARRRLILQTPRCRIKLKAGDKTWHICEPKPGSPSTGVMLFQVFDRHEKSLEEFGTGDSS